ncbi:MAG TPA: carboxyl transferase domain-containing protein [Microlunatus sp.]
MTAVIRDHSVQQDQQSATADQDQKSKQDQQGTKLAREIDPRNPNLRLAALLDEGSLELITEDDGSGMLAATGTIDGNQVVAFCSDATMSGGAMGNDGCAAVVYAYQRAMDEQLPIIGIWHAGGARLQEGVLSLDAVGKIFNAMTHASGRIPQISIVLGPAAGGAAYGPALTDVVILGPEGRIFVTGPDVVRSVTGEDVNMLRLGGPDTHGRRSGVVHLVADDEADALARGRKLIGLLSDQRKIDGEVGDDDLAALLPESTNRAYNVHPLVEALLDDDTMIELHARWAPNITIAFGRLGGRTVGVIANNPLRLGGCLDSLSAEKAARFVRMCDSFGVPLVVLVDVPGYLPGVGQEWDGVVRRGAKLLHAFSEAVVPRVTVVTRKAYGGAYIAMNARSLGATKVFAWPGAQVAVMGSVAAVRILHRRKLAATPEDLRPQLETELAAEHERIAGGVEKAVEIGVVDELVAPAATRSAIAAAIAAADTGARGRHGNIPL